MSVLLWPLLALLASACAYAPGRVPAQGMVEGQVLHTTVDSELARYYLEDYLQGQRQRPELDADLAANLDRVHSGPPPSIAEMQRWSQRYTVDVAALYLARKLINTPGNRSLQEEFNTELARLEKTPPAPDGALQKNYVVLFVPGWLYQSKPWTGADFAKPRALLTRLGVENYLIEIEDNATVEDNVQIIVRDLKHFLTGGKPVIIVSGSMGGPETAVVLGKMLRPEELTNVHAWINACGSIHGSPLADFWTSFPAMLIADTIFHIRGWGGLRAMASLKPELSRKRIAEVRIPPHIPVINYVGVPMSGDIRQYDKRYTYHQLRPWGPNDGLVLIPDELMPNALTVTEVGRGHFLNYPDIDLRIAALLRAVATRLANGVSLKPPIASPAAAR